MKHYYYILKYRQPVPAHDLKEWDKFFRSGARRVKKDDVGEYSVSTVFLGVEHGFDDNGQPFLFETMTFLEGADVYMIRATNWSDAVHNHKKEVRNRRRMLN